MRVQKRSIISVILIVLMAIGLIPCTPAEDIYADTTSQPGSTTQVKLVRIGQDSCDELGHTQDLQFVKFGEYDYEHHARNWFCAIRKGSSSSNSGEALYCIQPGTSISTGNQMTYVGDYWEREGPLNPTLSRQQTKTLLSKVLGVGYHGLIDDNWKSYSNNWNDTKKTYAAHYIATQLLVWEVMVGERDADFNHVTVSGAPDEVLEIIMPTNPLKAKIMGKYNEMVQSIKTSNTIPSFLVPQIGDAPIHEMEKTDAGYSITITDTNNVLEHYTFASSISDVSFSKNGDKLTITSATRPDAPFVITGSKAINGNTVIAWINNSKQNLIGYGPSTDQTVQGYAMADAAFNPADYLGTISGIKTDNNGEPLSGATIGLFSDDETVFSSATALATSITDDNGMFAFTEQTFGDYIVAEIAAPTGYILTDTFYPVTLDENGQSVEIIIPNDPVLGSIRGQKVDQSGTLLNDALIGLFPAGTTDFSAANAYRTCRTGTIASGLSSNAVGVFGWDGVSLGSYIVREIEPPIGYELNTQEYPVTIDMDNYSTTIYIDDIVNVRGNSAIKGIKMTGVFVPVPCALMGLFSGNETRFTEETAIQVCETDELGRFVFNNVAAGEYIVREIAAPAGYVLSSESFPVTVPPNQSDEVNIIDVGIIRNDANTFNFRKLGPNTGSQQGLAGAVFGLFAWTDAPNASFTIANALMTATSDDVGNVEFFAIPTYGTYIIRELQAPPGYVLTDDEIVIEVNENGCEVVSYTGESSAYIRNLPITGTIRGRKVDESGNGLPGATIGLFEKNTEFFVANAAIATVVSNETGEFAFTDVPVGNYIVCELAAPEGYILSSTNYPVTIDGESSSQDIDIGDIVNEKITWGIIGIKTDQDGNGIPGALIGLYLRGELLTSVYSDNTGHFSFMDLENTGYEVAEIAAPEGYSLDTRRYRVMPSANGEVVITIKNTLITGDITGCKIDSEGKTIAGAVFGLYKEDELITTATSETDGVFTFNDVAYGSYIIQEISAPTGYVLSDTSYPVTIDGGNAVINIGDIVNDLIVGSIIGIKCDQDAETLAGAIIGLFDELETEFSAENAIVTAVSAANGEFSFTEVAYGNYIVREIAAPEGYVLSDESYPVTIDSDGEVVNIENIVNTIMTGSISGYKINEVGDGLAGAVIGLFSENETNFAIENAILTSTSDSNGRYSFMGVSYGNYRIKEITAPTGYILSAQIIEVSITQNGQTVQVEEDIKNTLIRGSVSGMKVDETQRPVSGALIGLYRADDTVNAIDTATSAADGSFSFKNIPYGTYIVKEIAAPTGFVLTDEEYEVAIAEQHQEISITIVNEHDLRRVDVTKRIYAADINWANGNPTFVFELTTTPSSRHDNAYHLSITFDREYVLAHTGADGYVEKMASFIDVVADQYVLTEKATLRYRLESITDVVNGIAFYGNEAHYIYGNCAVFDLDKSEYGAATFTNVKTNWADASHTSIVINVIN